MPSYDFRCDGCDAIRPVMTGFERSRALELVCTDCGGSMRVAPVLSVNVFRAARVDTPTAGAKKQAAKSCGHTYACRCAAIKLSKPNPFAKQMDNGDGGP